MTSSTEVDLNDGRHTASYRKALGINIAMKLSWRMEDDELRITTAETPRRASSTPCPEACEARYVLVDELIAERREAARNDKIVLDASSACRAES